MKHLFKFLTKPFRFILAIFMLIINSAIFCICFIVLLIWNFDFKFIPVLMKEYEAESFFQYRQRFNTPIMGYKTFWDYVNGNKVIIKNSSY